MYMHACIYVKLLIVCMPVCVYKCVHVHVIFFLRRRTNSTFEQKRQGQDVPVQVHRVNESMNNRINSNTKTSHTHTHTHTHKHMHMRENGGGKGGKHKNMLSN